MPIIWSPDYVAIEPQVKLLDVFLYYDHLNPIALDAKVELRLIYNLPICDMNGVGLELGMWVDSNKATRGFWYSGQGYRY